MTTPRTHASSSDLAQRFAAVRSASEALTAPLSAEDATAQSMPDASPAKWHLAHTTWFFETFVLESSQADFRPFHPDYRVLFNSYYHTVGEQYARPARGLVTRPGLDEVRRYRAHVDEALAGLLERGALDDAMLAVVELGLHHEQQHQELIVTDLKHLLSHNPTFPAYRPDCVEAEVEPVERLGWLGIEGGTHEIGHGDPGFRFDNESPRHEVLLHDFELASRLTTNGEYLEFMSEGGYERPEWWLSDGWATVEERRWRAPAYWVRREGAWYAHTLGGLRRLREDEPVTHLSAYEADAFARWAGARLPTEFEWECVAQDAPMKGNFVENERFHPSPAASGEPADGPRQLFGDTWEWTQSAYAPYPGYEPPAGALGEYNGKFMVNQLVLRGGSCATPNSHIRPSYRNFFYPDARWQFSGLRLARNA